MTAARPNGAHNLISRCALLPVQSPPSISAHEHAGSVANLDRDSFKLILFYVLQGPLIEQLHDHQLCHKGWRNWNGDPVLLLPRNQNQVLPNDRSGPS